MTLFTSEIKTDVEAQQRVREWIAALRSGDYQQATGYLRTPVGFCCLGVACDLYDPSRWGTETRSGGEYQHFRYLDPNPDRPGEVAGLPPSVREALRLRTADGWLGGGGESAYLAGMNDDGVTFNAIADVIERELTRAIA